MDVWKFTPKCEPVFVMRMRRFVILTLRRLFLIGSLEFGMNNFFRGIKK